MNRKDVRGTTKTEIAFDFTASPHRSPSHGPTEDSLSDIFKKLFAKDPFERKKEKRRNGCQQCWHNLKERYRTWSARTPDINIVWRDSFKRIDGFFGSAAAVSFLYTRWILFHNLGLFILWGLAVIVRPSCRMFSGFDVFDT